MSRHAGHAAGPSVCRDHVLAAEDLRVLQVSDLYPPAIGGTERHVQNLARELARRGRHSVVATMRVPGQPAFEIGAAGERVYRISGLGDRTKRLRPSGLPFHPPVSDPRTNRQLAHIIEVERPNVVYAHNWMVYSCVRAAGRSQVPVVFVLHDYCVSCPAKSLWRAADPACSHTGRDAYSCAVESYGTGRGVAIRSMQLLANRRTSRMMRFVAISRAVADAAAGPLGNPPIEIIPTFINDGVADEALSVPRPNFLPDTNYLLFVGALGTHKGLDVLLAAHDGLPRPRPMLVVIGSGSPDGLDQLADDVIVARNVDHASVMAAWQGCLFGIVPSVWPEPFGQVAVEAMTMGKPVVASAIGGLAELIEDGVTGLLTPPGDVESLGAAMQLLLDDPQLRATLGEKAASVAAALTVGTVADRVENYLLTVLDEAGKSGVATGSPAGAVADDVVAQEQ